MDFIQCVMSVSYMEVLISSQNILHFVAGRFAYVALLIGCFRVAVQKQFHWLVLISLKILLLNNAHYGPTMMDECCIDFYLFASLF